MIEPFKVHELFNRAASQIGRASYYSDVYCPSGGFVSVYEFSGLEIMFWPESSAKSRLGDIVAGRFGAVKLGWTNQYNPRFCVVFEEMFDADELEFVRQLCRLYSFEYLPTSVPITGEWPLLNWAHVYKGDLNNIHYLLSSRLFDCPFNDGHNMTPRAAACAIARGADDILFQHLKEGLPDEKVIDKCMAEFYDALRNDEYKMDFALRLADNRPLLAIVKKDERIVLLSELERRAVGVKLDDVDGFKVERCEVIGEEIYLMMKLSNKCHF